VIVGVPLGVISAVRQEHMAGLCAARGQPERTSLPAFWLGLLILMAFVRWLGTIPIYDRVPEELRTGAVAVRGPGRSGRVRSSALIMRLTRVVRCSRCCGRTMCARARSKGMPESSVTFDHALRNALLPVITTIGIETAILSAG